MSFNFGPIDRLEVLRGLGWSVFALLILILLPPLRRHNDSGQGSSQTQAARIVVTPTYKPSEFSIPATRPTQTIQNYSTPSVTDSGNKTSTIIAPKSEPFSSPIPTQTLQSEPVNLTGERYPETRTRLLVPAEIQGWSQEKLRYAINEIFARHGATFPDKAIHNWFSQLNWYHPVTGASFDQIENTMSDIERQNIRLLRNAEIQYRILRTAMRISPDCGQVMCALSHRRAGVNKRLMFD